MAYPNRADLNDAWDENPDHEADDLRDRDTQDLIEWLAIERTKGVTWGTLVVIAGRMMRLDTVMAYGPEVVAFAATYGWPDTLRVIAHAMQAES